MIILNNSVLLDRALNLATRLREYQAEEERGEKSMKEYEAANGAQWGSESDYSAKSEKMKSERLEARDRHFQQTFKIDAVHLRNEILSRLPPGQPPGGIWGPGGEYRIDLSQYDKIIYTFQLDTLARHLEGIAKLLPVTAPTDPPTSIRNS